MSWLKCRREKRARLMLVRFVVCDGCSLCHGDVIVELASQEWIIKHSFQMNKALIDELLQRHPLLLLVRWTGRLLTRLLQFEVS